MSDASPPASRIVRSRLPDVDIPDMSVTDYTFRSATDDAERVAIIDGVDGAVWTRGAVLDHVRRLAGGLFERGIATGSTVALIAGNGPKALLLGHPDVADAAVIGVPDAQVGEIPTAFVVTRPGHRLTSQDVIDHVAGRVASYKRIRRVEFIDEIPKSAAGKILRRELHTAAADLAADGPPSR